MTELKLDEKDKLVNNAKFQSRINGAAKEHARYQSGLAVSQFIHYNVALQKLKAFARKVVKSGIGIDFISEFVTSLIGEIPDTINVGGVDHPTLEKPGEPFDVQTNQFSDVYLNNNPIIVNLFAQYAGVEPGDVDKQIIL